MSNKTLYLDLDKLLDIALKGVRRSSVFMGLGVNAAIDKSFDKFQLSSITNIQLIPDEVPAEMLEHFKHEFRVWIEAGGFRELSESFGVYLDEVHYICLKMTEQLRPGSFKKLEKENSNFRKQGVPNKLNMIGQRFGVFAQHSDYLVSLNRARNCLTHRRGVVGDDDLKDRLTLEICWLGADLLVEEPNGIRHNVTEMPTDGLFLENGGVVHFQFVERIRNFDRGEILLLSTRDLAEICWFYDREARAMIMAVANYANALGAKLA